MITQDNIDKIIMIAFMPFFLPIIAILIAPCSIVTGSMDVIRFL